MHKSVFMFMLLMVFAVSSNAQLSIGSSGMTIKSGTTFAADSVVLIPSADLTLSNFELTGSNEVIPGITTGASINHVGRLSSLLTFTGTIGMFYSDAQLNGNDPALLELAYEQSDNTWITTSGTASDIGARYFTQTFAGPVELLSVTATTAGITLPATIVSISAANEGGRNKVAWVSASEINLAHYEVERSADGRQFSKIDQVKAEDLAYSYAIYDRSPISGTNYYRLKLINDNGSFTYSKTVHTATYASNPEFALNAYPNPVISSMTIEIAGAKSAGTIELSDVSGRMLEHHVIQQGNTVYMMNMASYTAGVYFVRYSDGVNIQSVKFEKQ